MDERRDPRGTGSSALDLGGFGRDNGSTGKGGENSRAERKTEAVYQVWSGQGLELPMDRIPRSAVSYAMNPDLTLNLDSFIQIKIYLTIIKWIRI